jgi:cytoskeletal protein CcmA (bactofilin family)
MFGRQNIEPKGMPVTDPTLTGIIEQGSAFEGKLSFSGTFRINGQFNGEVFTPDTLVIGPDARVNGKVEAGTVIISGEFTGVVAAKYRVEIQRPAIFKGDILTPSLSVQEGVVFEGQSKMGSPDA